MDEHIDTRRRAATAALFGAGAALALPGCRRDSADTPQVSDIAGIDRTAVARIARPRSVAEVAALLRDSQGAVSIGGARYSMGGQIGAAGSLHLHLHLRELVGLVSAAALVAAPPLLRTGSAAPACAVRSHLQGRSCVSGSRCGSSPS